MDLILVGLAGAKLLGFNQTYIHLQKISSLLNHRSREGHRESHSQLVFHIFMRECLLLSPRAGRPGSEYIHAIQHPCMLIMG
jgi:hypothetical protein